MIAKSYSGRMSVLDQLQPEQQQALYSYCEKATLAEGRNWLQDTHGISLGGNSLGRWLRKERANRSALGPDRKVRPDNKLAMLAPEQQEIVFEECEGISLENGVSLLQREFQIEVTASSLANWLNKRRGDGRFLDG